MGRRDTKEHIVDAAVRLFNERGSGAVSTNHIAEAAGISPGNLYYHFRNKEEIILQSYQRALVAYDEIWEGALTAAPSPAVLGELLDETFDTQWRYRFLQRELPWLVQTDEAIRKRYREVQERRQSFLAALFEGWVSAGVARPLPGTNVEDLLLAAWVVGDQWLAHLEATGAAHTEADVRRGSRLVLEILSPHLANGAAASTRRAER